MDCKVEARLRMEFNDGFDPSKSDQSKKQLALHWTESNRIDSNSTKPRYAGIHRMASYRMIMPRPNEKLVLRNK